MPKIEYGILDDDAAGAVLPEPFVADRRGAGAVRVDDVAGYRAVADRRGLRRAVRGRPGCRRAVEDAIRGPRGVQRQAHGNGRH